MQFEEFGPADERTGHPILLAHTHVAATGVDHRDDADVDRPDGCRVVVEEADDARRPSPGQEDLLLHLPAQGVVDDILAIHGVDMAADTNRAEPVEAAFHPLARTAHQEDPVALGDDGVGDHLLEGGVLLHLRPRGEATPRPEDREERLVARPEPVRRAAREELLARHHPDHLSAGDHARLATTAPMRCCTFAASPRPRCSRQRARS